MSMPLDLEEVPANPVQASEGAVEFLVQIVRKAGAVALDEAIPSPMPFAVNVDGVN